MKNQKCNSEITADDAMESQEKPQRAQRTQRKAVIINLMRMRYALVFILLAGLLSACAGHGHADPPVLKQTDWTAGIVSDAPELRSNAPFSVVVAVRAAQHEDYDRIVFEFSEAGITGYRIEYIDEPVRTCGSGETVPLPGDGWLMVQLTAARMHDMGQATVLERQQELGFATVLELVATCDFENIVTWVAAVFEPNRFRVLELDGPPRLVVDILH